jgi:flagellum-specific peptidoglycan hydrolase FlgJ
MAKCVRVESAKKEDEPKFVKYYYDDGTVEVREGGSRAWRNKNPGNVAGGNGALGKDYGGLAIFPDLETGKKARRALFEPGGKYYDYGSIREALWGKFDKEGYQINGTGYAPKWNEKGEVVNNPDQYADFVRRYFQENYNPKYRTDLDIEKLKIRDYTDEMLEALEAAQEQKEGTKEETTRIYDKNGRLISESSGQTRSKSLPGQSETSGRPPKGKKPLQTSLSYPIGPRESPTQEPQPWHQIVRRNSTSWQGAVPAAAASAPAGESVPTNPPFLPVSSLPPARKNLLASAPRFLQPDARLDAESYRPAPQPRTPRPRSSYSARDQLDFLGRVYPSAKVLSEQTGIALPFILGHAGHEVDWGKSIQGNNLFNLKADDTWKRPTYTRNDTAYRSYPSYAESMKDYLAHLEGNPRYGKLFEPVTRGSLDRLIDALQYSGYSNDPDYGARILQAAQSPLVKRAVWQYSHWPTASNTQ